MELIKVKNNILCGLVVLLLTLMGGVGCKITTPVVTPEESLQKETAPTDEKLEVKADTAYRIGPGDVLHISVWGNEELTSDRGQGIMVRPDGKISIPLLQDVTAEGLTTEELRSVIETRLKEFVVEPIVTVTVLEVNFPKYFIMGEIANPGTYPLRQRTTILQAISLAGGFTDFASTSNIIVIRERNPYQERIKVDYHELLKPGSGDKILYLIPGDTIIIP